MPLEAWMLRTILVIFAVNGVNIVLFWIARRVHGGAEDGRPAARIPHQSHRAAPWRRAAGDRAARRPAHLMGRGGVRRGGLDFVRDMRNAVPRPAGEPFRTRSHASGH